MTEREKERLTPSDIDAILLAIEGQRSVDLVKIARELGLNWTLVRREFANNPAIKEKMQEVAESLMFSNLDKVMTQASLEGDLQTLKYLKDEVLAGLVFDPKKKDEKGKGKGRAQETKEMIDPSLKSELSKIAKLSS